jgi:hypothetical protein
MSVPRPVADEMTDGTTQRSREARDARPSSGSREENRNRRDATDTRTD